MPKKYSQKQQPETKDSYDVYDDNTGEYGGNYQKVEEKEEKGRWWILILVLFLVALLGVGLFMIAFYRAATWHEHVYRTEITQPTCEDIGFTTYVCDCGDMYIKNFTDPTGHEYTAETVGVSCTEDGYILHVCAKCQKSYKSDVVQAKGHVYTQELLKQVTCTEDGEIAYTCTVCDEDYPGHAYTEIVTAKGHDWKETTVNATCSAAGYEKKECRTCGKTEITELPKIEHSWYVTAVEATCTEDGRETKTCTVCQQVETVVTQRAKGHAEQLVTVEKSCTKEGRRETVCSRCQAVLTRSTTSPIGYHTFADGTCSVCGVAEYVNGFKFQLAGSYPDYTYTAIAYKGTEAELVMPSVYDDYPVTAMKNSVLQNNTRMETVILSSNLVTIEEGSFRGCTALKSASLPEGITSLPEALFLNCSSLTNFTIPSTVREIGKSCFLACTSLTGIVIPEGVKIIESGTFNACSSLSSVTLSSTLEKIGMEAFYHCDSLRSITLPAALIQIQDSAFRLSALTNVVFAGTEEEWTNVTKSDDAFPAGVIISYATEN